MGAVVPMGVFSSSVESQLISRVVAVVVGNYRDLFIALATSAATLIGLLFVAMSVSTGRSQAHPAVIREFRAAASLLAFTDAFTVPLFGLVPGNNIGYPAAAVGAVGIFFLAAGVRTILSLPSTEKGRRPQLALVVGLFFVFGLQIVYGIELIVNPRRTGALAKIGDLLIVSLLIGIGRAWEFVGEWDTGLISSIGRLIGHQPRAQAQAQAQAPAEAPTPAEDDEGGGG
jgi:hypothetical protein